MTDLTGKTAFVTAAAQGIGRATALAMAREGARVAVADFEEASAASTVAAINQAGGQAISLTGDVTDSSKVKAMVAAVVSGFGRLEITPPAVVEGYDKHKIAMLVDALREAHADIAELLRVVY